VSSHKKLVVFGYCAILNVLWVFGISAQPCAYYDELDVSFGISIKKAAKSSF